MKHDPANSILAYRDGQPIYVSRCPEDGDLYVWDKHWHQVKLTDADKAKICWIVRAQILDQSIEWEDDAIRHFRNATAKPAPESF